MAAPRVSYDVVIVGGGPAGSAAAIAAAKRELRALVIERGDVPAVSTCAGWLGPAASRLCAQAGVKMAAAGVAFMGLRVRSWDFKHCVEVKDRDLAGFVVQQPQLSRLLLEGAEAHGAKVLRRTVVEELRLGEAAATLRLSNGITVVGQVVLIADGAVSRTAEMVHLPAAQQLAASAACASAVSATERPGNGLDVILGTGRGLKLATVARGRSELRVTLLTHDDSAPATTQLAALLDAARAADVVPAAFDGAPTQAHCLAGTALEMESHVGKRCLLVGDAGGFVSAFSHEGIYPALRSGWLAAETVARAVKAPVLQDELASFSAAWRAELADYLRMPSADLGLLMPMVFSNAQMTRRVARAFLLGQAF